MIELVRSLWRHRRLLRDFVVRDLRARYVGSSMGFFWSVIFPIVNLCVYMFVFRVLLRTRFDDQASETSTALVMLAGIMVWQAFAETLSRATNCLVENSNLIQKIVFPSEILPAYLGVSALVNMVIGLPIVILGVLFLSPHERFAPTFNADKFGPAILLLPLLVGLQFLFTIGLGYLLAAVNLLLRDVFHVIGVLTTVWMFATPIFYPPRAVETANYGWLLDVNPMHWLIEAYRDVLTDGDWPQWQLVARFALVALLTLAVGAQVFMRQRRRFPDLL